MMMPSLAMLIFDSPTQILVVLVLAMLLFGGKKIGELGKGLGEGIKNFKTSIKGDDEKPTDTNAEKKV